MKAFKNGYKNILLSIHLVEYLTYMPTNSQKSTGLALNNKILPPNIGCGSLI